MFYILIIAALLATFWMLLRIRKLKRHDDVLYDFCEIRRQAMQHLRDEKRLNALTRQEYISLRKLLTLINVIISQYKSHKFVMFNLRYFIRYLAAFKRQNRKTQAIEETNNADIELLRKNIQRALLLGFVKYTPFIKSEFVIKLSIFLLGMLARVGLKTVNRYIDSLKEAFDLAHGNIGHTPAHG